MREIELPWKGTNHRLVPSFQVLARIAQELAQISGGTETTVSLAGKCVHGGLEPLYVVVPLYHFLQQAMGAEAPSREEVLQRLLEDPKELVGFRSAYVEAMLPSVNLGKGPAAPSEPKAESQGT